MEKFNQKSILRLKIKNQLKAYKNKIKNYKK